MQDIMQFNQERNKEMNANAILIASYEQIKEEYEGYRKDCLNRHDTKAASFWARDIYRVTEKLNKLKIECDWCSVEA
jgi:hypothetical protein